MGPRPRQEQLLLELKWTGWGLAHWQPCPAEEATLAPPHSLPCSGSGPPDLNPACGQAHCGGPSPSSIQLTSAAAAGAAAVRCGVAAAAAAASGWSGAVAVESPLAVHHGGASTRSGGRWMGVDSPAAGHGWGRAPGRVGCCCCRAPACLETGGGSRLG